MSDSPANPSDTGKEPPKPTRRELIAGIAALVAGAAASTAPREAGAVSGGNLVIDAVNTANNNTMLAVSNSNGGPKAPGFDVRQATSGIAFHAEAGPQTNFAMVVSSTADIAISGISDSVAVVGGTGLNRIALRNNVLAAGAHSAGLFAFSNTADAPAIKAFHGPDVNAFSPTGTAAALHTLSNEEGGVSALIEHGDGGVALHVKGTTVFEGDVFGTGSGLPASCRRINIPAGVSVFNFNDPEVDPDGMAFATFNNLAGRTSAPVWVTHVNLFPGRLKFTFNGPTQRIVPLSYIYFRACPVPDNG